MNTSSIDTSEVVRGNMGKIVHIVEFDAWTVFSYQLDSQTRTRTKGEMTVFTFSFFLFISFSCSYFGYTKTHQLQHLHSRRTTGTHYTGHPTLRSWGFIEVSELVLCIWRDFSSFLVWGFKDAKIALEQTSQLLSMESIQPSQLIGPKTRIQKVSKTQNFWQMTTPPLSPQRCSQCRVSINLFYRYVSPPKLKIYFSFFFVIRTYFFGDRKRLPNPMVVFNFQERSREAIIHCH